MRHLTELARRRHTSPMENSTQEPHENRPAQPQIRVVQESMPTGLLGNLLDIRVTTNTIRLNNSTNNSNAGDHHHSESDDGNETAQDATANNSDSEGDDSTSAAANAIANASISTDGARNLLSVLRSSQSFAPLVILILLKLFHEYAVPLFFFSMLILLRLKLDRHLVEQIKHKADLNVLVTFMILSSAALVVLTAYYLDYDHTGCYLLLQPPIPVKEPVGESKTTSAGNGGDGILADSEEKESSQIDPISSDESRLLWVLATAFRVDLVAQCACIGLKALIVLWSHVSFSILSNISNSDSRNRRNLLLSCWHKLVKQYAVMSMRVEKFIQDQSRMRRPHGDEREEDRDTTTLLSSPASREIAAHNSDRVQTASTGGTVTRDSEGDVNTSRSSYGFAHHRMLKRKLCLIEALFLAYRCALPTVVWCRYYAGMSSWADTLDGLGKYASHSPTLASFASCWISWLVTGQVPEDGNTEVPEDHPSESSASTDPLNAADESSESAGSSKDMSFASFMLGNSVSSSGLLFLLFYLLIKAVIFGYYTRDVWSVLKAIYPPSVFSPNVCTPLPATSTSSRVHFNSAGSRLQYYLNSMSQTLKKLSQCICSCLCCVSVPGSASSLATSIGFGEVANESDVAEAGNPDCPICFDTLERPVRLTPCGHLFCEV